MASAIQFDAYETLGIASNASVEDVKAAYRRIARRLHPDVNRTHPGAAAQFSDITAAYELLIDQAQRRAYDEAWRKRPQFPKFTLRVTLSKRAVAPVGETQVVYLFAEIIPDPDAAKIVEARESRLNLTLAIDHSRSMDGRRLEHVKIASHQVIDQLNPDDIFSVVAFNDFSEVIIPAGAVQDKAALKAKVSLITAGGSTEIFQGLTAALGENRKFLAPRLANNITLITDGNTYIDQQRTLDLAQEIAKQGIMVSAMGLGNEWNDSFLDQVTQVTGGHSEYIKSASGVVKFLNEHVRNLTRGFAERLRLSIAPDPDIRLESVFKLTPNAQPITESDGYFNLGTLQHNRIISLLAQLELPENISLGFRPLARLAVTGDVFFQGYQQVQLFSDLTVEVKANPPQTETPQPIFDALSKLTLYRMQERAQEALRNGDVQEAGKRLELLHTRALELGEVAVSQIAADGMNELRQTQAISEEGKKALKFGTRHLLAKPMVGE